VILKNNDLIVDEKGIYMVSRTSCDLEPSLLRLTVDHNEPGQALGARRSQLIETDPSPPEISTHAPIGSQWMWLKHQHRFRKFEEAGLSAPGDRRLLLADC
jgi:hypothetical protein